MGMGLLGLDISIESLQFRFIQCTLCVTTNPRHSDKINAMLFRYNGLELFFNIKHIDNLQE